MFAELKKTLRQTAIYSLGNLTSKVIGFILLPLYTDYLSVSEYGIFAILEATSQILIGIFGFNFTTSMMRWCVSEKSADGQKKIISSTFFATFIIAVIFSLITIPFKTELSELILSTPKFENYITILLLSVSFGILSNVPLEVIRFREKPSFYVFLNISKFVVIVLLNVYFIVYAKLGVEGIILSQLIGFIYLIIASFPFMLKNMNFSFSAKVIGEMFRFGFPLVFSTSALLALSLGDRYIIKYFMDEASVGVYSLGNKIASVINVFILQSFQVGYLPLAYKKINDENAPRYFSKVTTYLVFILMISALSLSIFGREIVKTFSLKTEYWDAYTVIPYISLAFVFRGMQYVFSLPFHFVKKTSYIAYVVVAAAVLNIAFNIIYISKYGYVAAGVVMLASYIFMTIVYYFSAKKHFFIPFEITKLFKMLFVGIILYSISLLVDNAHVLLRLPVKVILFLLFPFILYYINFYEKVELERIKGAYLKWKNPSRWKENFKKMKLL
ncbi:MAG: oligosaccharide flippase family protein [Ignavibacteriales bacterium]|nr:oligosaccharide flippase family protein [Ignavibacteriales bacterium]